VRRSADGPHSRVIPGDGHDDLSLRRHRPWLLQQNRGGALVDGTKHQGEIGGGGHEIRRLGAMLGFGTRLSASRHHGHTGFSFYIVGHDWAHKESWSRRWFGAAFT
jgi:hypothetical protein